MSTVGYLVVYAFSCVASMCHVLCSTWLSWSFKDFEEVISAVGRTQ